MPPPEPPYVPAGAPPPDRRGWWQNEVAIASIALLMLVLGGFLGYLLGHANAKTKTKTLVEAAPAKPVHSGHPSSGAQTVASVKTVTTPGHAKTVTTPGHAVKSVTAPARTHTVTTPARVHTVTTPAHTVTVRQPAKVVKVATTTTVTSTATATATHTVTAPQPSGQAASGGTQSFYGSGSQTIPSIHVASASVLRWSCSGCSGSFTITNSSSDQSSLSVQGQNAASGQVDVAAGDYTQVAVQGSGSWTFTIAPAA
jgi:hypothetical protein